MLTVRMRKKGAIGMDCTPPLGHLINHCGHMVRLYIDMQLREYDITPVQSHTLMFLKRTEGQREVTQRDLERELRLKAPTVNGLVDRLEERGLIRRKTSKTDARCRLLALTKAGHALADEFAETFHQSEEYLSSAFTAEEEAQLRALLTRLITNLENEVSNK